MQPVKSTGFDFNRYINYLKVGKNASDYTIRTYTGALLGNNTRGTQKGFFPFLLSKKIDSLDKVNKQVLRDYIMSLMNQRVAKSSITWPTSLRGSKPCQVFSPGMKITALSNSAEELPTSFLLES